MDSLPCTGGPIRHEVAVGHCATDASHSGFNDRALGLAGRSSRYWRQGDTIASRMTAVGERTLVLQPAPRVRVKDATEFVQPAA